jgi:hypothetical protein
MSVFAMKRASLIIAVLLLQFSYLPLVAQASPEEKAVGKAAGFYHQLDMARSGFKQSRLVETAKARETAPPQTQVVVPPQTQPEAVKANPAGPNK